MKFNTITDALKWCIDHPNQKLTDKDGRKIWFNLTSDVHMTFQNNLLENGAVVDNGTFNTFPSDFPKFDLPTLSPLPEPIKTQDIEDILKRVQELEKRFEEAKRWPVVSPFVGFPVLGSSAGWPVEG